jgi:hypothetical protein
MTLRTWKCPACQTQIRHNGEAPELRHVYHCHVCRLELVVDEKAQTMKVAPLDHPSSQSKRKR